MAWFVALLISLAFTALSYVLAPKPKSASRPPAVQDLQEPTIEDGPVEVVFGTKTIKSVKVLWYGEKYVRRHKEDA
jgi:hypothetical protein